MLLLLWAFTVFTFWIQGTSLHFDMAKCCYQIGGKRFKWTVPPEYTEESTKKFLFWDPRTKDLELDNEWADFKYANSKLPTSRYKYVFSTKYRWKTEVGLI